MNKVKVGNVEITSKDDVADLSGLIVNLLEEIPIKQYLDTLKIKAVIAPGYIG